MTKASPLPHGWWTGKLPGRKVMATTDGRYTLYRHDPAPLVMVKETTDRSEAMNWLKGVGPSATGETA